MSTLLDTVVEYETKVVDLVKAAKDPVVSYVAKGVELTEDRLPEVTYPSALPTPLEVVDTQVAFVKALIDANTEVVKAVLTTIAPIAGYKAPAKRTVKAAKAA